MESLEIARRAKQIDAGTVTVVGGAHVTFAAQENLAHPEIDLVVRNKGEITMLELFRLYLRGEGSLDRNRNSIEGAPKTLVWKSRFKVGKSKLWYETPEFR